MGSTPQDAANLGDVTWEQGGLLSLWSQGCVDFAHDIGESISAAVRSAQVIKLCEKPPEAWPWAGVPVRRIGRDALEVFLPSDVAPFARSRAKPGTAPVLE